MDLETPIPPDLEDYESFSPSFTLDVPSSNMQDQNTEERLREVEEVFKKYSERLAEKYRRKEGGKSRIGGG